MSTTIPVYLTITEIARGSGLSRTDARLFLTAWENLVITELNAGRAFSIPGLGRLIPRKTNRTNAQNPRTNTNIGTRLIRRVHLTPSQRAKDAMN